MKNRVWSIGDGRDCHYYSDERGRIIGEIGKIGTNLMKYYATVFPNNLDSLSLGAYISHVYAMEAVERYWLVQDGTLLESD